MSYQVLARKWRPQNFKQMVGQEHVLRALINALDSERLHHAYLFTGTRGVGKTTIARILAKCLNCETGITSEPCGTCNSCVEIAAGNFLDLIEVDAASRTKVEDTRELLENVQYAPTRARFKVYLIDEVHMLTGHSFNALLKTLEEPPPHVKFLFATTDPQKLPATILSRCLQFNLKRMPVDLISGHLEYLLKEESIQFEEPSLRLIARAADGSMRDALSLLDQSIAFSGESLTEASVREMLGTISHEPLLALLEAVSAGEGASLLQQIEDLSSVTPDFEAASDAMIALLHQLAVQQVVPEAINEDQSIRELANKLSKEEVQLYYQIALQGRRDLSLSPDPRSGFEMLLLRMMSFRPLREGMKLQTAAELSNKDSNPKKKTVATETLAGTTSVKESSAETRSEQKSSSNAEKEVVATGIPPPWDDVPPWDLDSTSKTTEKPVVDVVTESNNETTQIKEQKIEEKIKQPWHKVVSELHLTGRAAELIKHCLLDSVENGIISLVIEKGSAGLLADSTQQEIQDALLKYYGNQYSVDLTVAENLDLEPDSESSNQDTISPNETPAQRAERKEKEARQKAENNIASDPFVLELQNRFGAQIVPGSVHETMAIKNESNFTRLFLKNRNSSAIDAFLGENCDLSIFIRHHSRAQVSNSRLRNILCLKVVV